MKQSTSTDFPTLWKVIDRLDQASILYMLTGSMALNVYGHARATNDMDIVVQISDQNVQKLFRLFEKDFYVSQEAIKEAVANESLFNIIDNETVFKVDLIVAKKDSFSKQQFDRRREIKIGNRTIFVISPEDLILSKLEWSQESLSEIQENDIKNIMRVLDKGLDKKYLETWASARGFKERLKKIYDAVGYQS
ncbi:MAG: hypothetical protein A3F82_00985 [Deltaproteobacteria bacterium RIFCSPLOWO2_12_FULL_44_12]|nr:MAG: hypothetical protein A2712_03970 [Deltaproteobacteria bacterium RIFCSPHIGHO2_01_FULL_43_49]OGQ16343.1 MAG: hypothetical protein A3D22_01940 [Deltaproteobacteria bacterium RIFCSPHIGHO2_02_FULL_44_53]OGQ29304.1 MAG: hypothetical protein A3D98_05725 [Deltaproteobacteria bacterium RIFCSPHIGHO2_12_FULL_44_21]OGQ32861.1 MAG: hypothetical protein A2979_09870 [Deltaproteobacteria bacterium RIFCSPLOWO2_01_FULL_45_74]OGQ41962.1 MAG: hypothetical protein A3I70_09655 [Deltaproteobacteria bacterium 